MKIIKKTILIIAGFMLITGCEKAEPQYDNELLMLKHAKNSNHAYDKGHGLDQERFIKMKSTDLDIHYRIIGQGPVNMVFIPGWTNPLTVYQKQFDFFRDKARCIYIDLPGQGLSDADEGIDYTMELMADAIYDVLKKEGVHKFVAVGFSMGPVTLGQFELKYPGMITRLVNIDGGFNPWPPEGDPSRDQFIIEREGFLAWMETFGVPEKQWLASTLLHATSPPDLIEFIDYFYEFPSWLMANIYKNYSSENVNQPIGWTFPILSIYPNAPANMEIEQLYFPNSRIEVIKETGHVIQWEKHEIVNALIDEFLPDKPGREQHKSRSRYG